MEKLKKAVLSTLAYADVFDYPLTLEEIGKWLTNVKCPAVADALTGKQKSKLIQEKNGFYFLKGKERIVELREKRERWSRQKLEIAERVTAWLKLIPWVKMVGATGSLPLLNSDKGDDIDILIVSSKGRLWLTRFLSTILIDLVAKRRRPGDKDVKDKICLNMFLDEDNLGVPKKEQDFFSAHEVCQMKVQWSREGVYERFLGKNQWVRKYLPNIGKWKRRDLEKSLLFSQSSKMENGEWKKQKKSTFFEKLARAFQLWYMRRRRTTEIISSGIIRFHPQDARKWVLREYNLRLEKLGLDPV